MAAEAGVPSSKLDDWYASLLVVKHELVVDEKTCTWNSCRCIPGFAWILTVLALGRQVDETVGECDGEIEAVGRSEGWTYSEGFVLGWDDNEGVMDGIDEELGLSEGVM